MSNATIGASVSLKLAEVVHSIRYDALPPEAVDYAKTLMLDSIGCLTGGLDSKPARISREFALQLGGAPAATVVGTSMKCSAPLAVFTNGTALRYLDFNDGYSRRDSSHPSGNFPVALAMAEAHGRSGRDLLRAMIAGYEVHLRLCNFSGAPALKKRGWHHTCNLQFSAAAAASLLLSDDPAVTANAMSLAGSHCNSLAQIQHGKIAMIKATADAWIAKCGVEAALLASLGLTGPEEIFEGNAGWAKIVSGEIDFDNLLAPAAGKYFINEVRIKPYAAVGPAAAPIQAAVDLHRSGQIDAEQIDTIVVRLPGQVVGDPAAGEGKRYPANRETADHSYHYCTVIALLEGECGEEQYAPAKLGSDTVRQLLSKVTLEADEALTAQWPRASGGGVIVKMKDGSIHERHHPITPGHPRNPLSMDQVVRKYERQMAARFTKQRTDHIRAAVDTLESCENVAEFTSLLAG